MTANNKQKKYNTNSKTRQLRPRNKGKKNGFAMLLKTTADQQFVNGYRQVNIVNTVHGNR